MDLKSIAAATRWRSPPRYLLPKPRRRGNSSFTSYSRLAFMFKRMFESGWDTGGWAMPQNVPLLNRVLGTAAVASVIAALLMSQQLSRAAEPPTAKVMRLHSK
jgi:hypothetical protein